MTLTSTLTPAGFLVGDPSEASSEAAVLQRLAQMETKGALFDQLQPALQSLINSGGWVPVLAIIPDGNRRVVQLINWTGGIGTATKPDVGMYMGSGGFVSAIADAMDVRGVSGTKGDAGDKGLTGDKGSAGPSPLVSLGTVNLTQTATIAIAVGMRTVTLTGISGLLAGDAAMLTPVSALPDGYAIHNAVATVDGTLKVVLTAPVLAIGASYSIPCKLVVLR